MNKKIDPISVPERNVNFKTKQSCFPYLAKNANANSYNLLIKYLGNLVTQQLQRERNKMIFHNNSSKCHFATVIKKHRSIESCCRRNHFMHRWIKQVCLAYYTTFSNYTKLLIKRCCVFLHSGSQMWWSRRKSAGSVKKMGSVQWERDEIGWQLHVQYTCWGSWLK